MSKASLDSIFDPVTQVVNMRNEEYDVRIDRATDWGNPFSHLEYGKAKWKVKTREEAIEKYREYIKTRPDLLARLEELRGKRLGCWCKPKACHGDVLLELLNA